MEKPEAVGNTVPGTNLQAGTKGTLAKPEGVQEFPASRICNSRALGCQVEEVCRGHRLSQECYEGLDSDRLLDQSWLRPHGIEFSEQSAQSHLTFLRTMPRQPAEWKEPIIVCFGTMLGI